MNNISLEKIINKKLNSEKIKDYCPNGLQIEGTSEINNIICGVTASQELIDIGIKNNVDAIIVHHGYFWKNEKKIIRGIMKNRIKSILDNNINLYSWHLPLDIHEKLGNNVQIAKKLNINIKGNILPYVLWGEFDSYITGTELFHRIKSKYCRTPLHFDQKFKKIKKIAWCSGKGQSFFHDAINFKIDAYITGEVSEETMHIAKENKVHFFSSGHHATECDGIKKLGLWLSKNFDLNVQFINLNNPV
ncbi:Nif3-like dinuclear metal center hexameric protein [Buchnera aphidicola (Kurisakia onigurumii)]|uniref:Nif3-like dinuclear metal center hexameric protein n=1 Tax=Buchnera aphidicola TaxID=9 RepID=UPI0031B720E6